MKQSERDACATRAQGFFERAGIVLTKSEKAAIEVADFGLGEVERVGLELLTYVNTEHVCAKEMVLFPWQTCPEHSHPEKEETFRCRSGQVFLYVEGEGDANAVAGGLPCTPVTVFHEIKLSPGAQHTILPGTKHWFRGGAEGAVVSEFSTHSSDETDVFTDPRIVRAPKIEPDEGGN